MNKIPVHMLDGVINTDTIANFNNSVQIFSKGTILIADLGTGYYSLKIADGVNKWSNLPESMNNGNALQVYSGILTAGNDTITLPWSYNISNPNILVFVGTLKQRASVISYPSTTSIKLPYAVQFDTEVEVLMIPNNLIPALMNSNHNYIVDGAFDFWYEGTTQSTSGYGSDTMWTNPNVGSTKVHSQQSFSVGAVFPDGVICPTYYSRTVVTSVAGVNNYVIKQHRIEDVGRLAGKTLTLSFYAKADTVKNIAIELNQNFGTGGSPSTDVVGAAIKTITLSAVWTKYTITFTLPSISGKTLGTTANTSYTWLNFWFDAGSGFNSRTNNLIQQSGTFDIALVKLEEGYNATPYVRDLELEGPRVWRYYQTLTVSLCAYATVAGTYFGCPVPMLTGMRGTAVCSTLTGGSPSNMGSDGCGAINAYSIRYFFQSSSTGKVEVIGRAFNADARL